VGGYGIEFRSSGGFSGRELGVYGLALLAAALYCCSRLFADISGGRRAYAS